VFTENEHHGIMNKFHCINSLTLCPIYVIKGLEIGSSSLRVVTNHPDESPCLSEISENLEWVKATPCLIEREIKCVIF